MHFSEIQTHTNDTPRLQFLLLERNLKKGFIRKILMIYRCLQSPVIIFICQKLFFSFCICLEIYYTIMYYFCYPSNLWIQEAWNPDDCVHNVLSLVKKAFSSGFFPYNAHARVDGSSHYYYTALFFDDTGCLCNFYVIRIIEKYKRLRIGYTLYGKEWRMNHEGVDR